MDEKRGKEKGREGEKEEIMMMMIVDSHLIGSLVGSH